MIMLTFSSHVEVVRLRNTNIQMHSQSSIQHGEVVIVCFSLDKKKTNMVSAVVHVNKPKKICTVTILVSSTGLIA